MARRSGVAAEQVRLLQRAVPGGVGIGRNAAERRVDVNVARAFRRLDIAVDADELAAVYRMRETILAKSMAPLRAFDKAQLYQLSKASSTKTFLENTVGLSPADAGGVAGLCRKLGAMPETEARFVDGRLSSGQVRAVAANVAARLVPSERL